MYLTKDVSSYDDFVFDEHKAVNVAYFHSPQYGINEAKAGDENNGQALCAQTKEMMPVGRHVLTIVNPSTEFVGISTVLLPSIE